MTTGEKKKTTWTDRIVNFMISAWIGFLMLCGVGLLINGLRNWGDVVGPILFVVGGLMAGYFGHVLWNYWAKEKDKDG